MVIMGIEPPFVYGDILINPYLISNNKGSCCSKPDQNYSDTQLTILCQQYLGGGGKSLIFDYPYQWMFRNPAVRI